MDAAVALQILGEVLLASGSWEIGFALADPDHQGQWLAPLLTASSCPLDSSECLSVVDAYATQQRGSGDTSDRHDGRGGVDQATGMP